MRWLRKYPYWTICAVGCLCCLAGIIWGYCANEADYANRAGVIGVAITFGTLFFDRGTAFRVLRNSLATPHDDTDAHATVLQDARRLASARDSDADNIRRIIADLTAFHASADRMLEEAAEETDPKKRENLRRKAQNIHLKVDTALKALPDPSGPLIEALFLARQANEHSARLASALSGHLKDMESEALPIALLSFVATICSGWGEVLVNLLP